MFKQINNWHLTFLVGVLSLVTVLSVNSYVSAQWTDPTDLPGGTPANSIVVTPMVQDLQMGGKDILDSNLRIDGNGQNVIQIDNGAKICFNGTTDCIDSWSAMSGGLWSQSGSDIYYDLGNVGIGTAAPTRLLDLDASGSVFGSYPAEAARLRITANAVGRQAPGLEFLNVDRNANKVAKIVSRDHSVFSFEYEDKGTDENPASYEELFVMRKNAASEPEFRLQNKVDESSSQIVFEEGGEGDNFVIKYNGASNIAPLNRGYNNWLEFWGADALPGGGNGPNIPIMIMERDYDSVDGGGSPLPSPTYAGVGIGVPARTHIDAKLRVQNYGTEDILQLYDNSTKVFSVVDGGRVAIGNASPTHNLDVFNTSGNAEIAIKTGSNTHWGMYQDNASGEFRLWHDDNALALNRTAASTDMRLHNPNGYIKFIFQEYASEAGDFFLNYNGDNPAVNGGYSNWLEFWGRDYGTNPGTAIPILTMQRDYSSVPTTDVYQGVGIGVPSQTLIDAKLRIRNGALGEDILQLYDQDTKVLEVSDGGDLTTWRDINLSHGNLTEGYNYVRIDHLVGGASPVAADCDGTNNTKGRMIFDYTNNRLYICSDAGLWKYAQLN